MKTRVKGTMGEFRWQHQRTRLAKGRKSKFMRREHHVRDEGEVSRVGGRVGRYKSSEKKTRVIVNWQHFASTYKASQAHFFSC